MLNSDTVIMIPRIRNCAQLALLLISLVVISTQGTQARGIIQFSNVPLLDFFSKLDFSQTFQLTKTDDVYDWIKWILKMGVGFLDPLYIGHLTLDVNETEASIHATGDVVTIRHLLLSQISNVTVEKTKLGVSANLTFPKVSLEGVYNLSGQLREPQTDLFGRGMFKITVTKLKLYGALRLNIGRKLLLRLEDMDYTVKGVDATLDNLMGGGAVSHLLNGIISDVGPIVMEELKSNITQAIMDEANKALAKFVPKN